MELLNIYVLESVEKICRWSEEKLDGFLNLTKNQGSKMRNTFHPLGFEISLRCKSQDDLHDKITRLITRKNCDLCWIVEQPGNRVHQFEVYGEEDGKERQCNYQISFNFGVSLFNWVRLKKDWKHYDLFAWFFCLSSVKRHESFIKQFDFGILLIGVSSKN